MENISITKLRPHPDNPRKDLGDLTELAESIKVNGILQNLTVVPVVGEITGQPTGDYTVIIGHRRLAAAKLAGLEEVPCVISDMTEVKQIRTMLSENMQRSDLTVYEQAQGFQMMLDMGDTVDEIAERAGFSQSTVRRRVKLLELDQEKFKKAEKRGATLMDYAKLEEIDDVAAKNKVLDAIGTNNFQRELQSAIDTQKFMQKREAWLEVIKTFATEDPDASYNTRRYVRNYGRWTNGDVEVPEDADTVKYYYKVSEREIDIYKDIDKAAEDAEKSRLEEKRRIENEIKARYESITEDHYSLRAEFVKGLSNTVCKKAMSSIALLFADVACIAPDLDIGGLGYVLDSELLEDDILDDSDFAALSKVPEIIEIAKTQPEKLAFSLVYCAADDHRQGYWYQEWHYPNYRYVYNENALLDVVYKTLEQLGYEMSDDEKAMQDGTHELFAKKESDDNQDEPE